MKVAKLYTLFLRNLGYSRSDAEEPDVQEEYRESALSWLNEGYVRAVERLSGTAAAQALTLLAADEDEPSGLASSLHGYLADYAAARAQEVRGSTASAAGLYAAFERGIAESGKKKSYAYDAWMML